MSKKPSSTWTQGDDQQKTQVKKARQKLFCAETMSGLDGIMLNPNVSNHSPTMSSGTTDDLRLGFTEAWINADLKRNGPGGSRFESINSKPNREDESYNSSKTTTSNLCPQHMTFDQTQRRNPSPKDRTFVKGLYNEFTKGNVNSSYGERGTMTLARSCETEQEVPDIVSDEDTNAVDMENDEQILVIPGDFLTSSGMDSDSGSDIDWSSLTPPVPRSPSDQRVPEMEEGMEKRACFTGLGSQEVPIHSQTEMPFDSLFGFNPFELEPLVSRRRSASDHVVPQFSG